MEEKVYREEDIKIIKNTRVVLEAKNLMNSVIARGASTVSNLTWSRFQGSCVVIDPSLLDRVTEEELKAQYREYVRRLESLAKELAKRELSDMELLEVFLDPANKDLYTDIESVMSVMVRASLLISVESVVESWISVMEHHASQTRSLGEMLLHEEMVIAITGPSLAHCDSVFQVTNIKRFILFIFLPHLSFRKL